MLGLLSAAVAKWWKPEKWCLHWVWQSQKLQLQIKYYSYQVLKMVKYCSYCKKKLFKEKYFNLKISISFYFILLIHHNSEANTALFTPQHLPLVTSYFADSIQYYKI